MMSCHVHFGENFQIAFICYYEKKDFAFYLLLFYASHLYFSFILTFPKNIDKGG
jgi:hypothetical protein